MMTGERRLDGTFVSDLPDVRLADIRGDDERIDGMSLWRRMLLSYSDMRAATRQLIGENPSEARLLFFVLLYPGISGLPVPAGWASFIANLPGGKLMYGA